ncbi:MAG: hypothetical protein C4555_03120 [Dehalococcoidia bacterium]|nr:MAG: hypothetical protein C4555_03120 [Dehalococcoidia bacterium]
MAVDTDVVRRRVFQGRYGMTLVEEDINLFTNQTTAADGVWMDATGWEALNVTYVIHSSTGTLKVDGAGTATVPANSTDGVGLASDLTASGYVSLQRHQLPKWVKVHPHAVGADVSIHLKITKLIGDNVTT